MAFFTVFFLSLVATFEESKHAKPLLLVFRHRSCFGWRWVQSRGHQVLLFGTDRAFSLFGQHIQRLVLLQRQALKRMPLGHLLALQLFIIAAVSVVDCRGIGLR